MGKEITVADLKRLLDERAELTLIDVLPEEYFAAEHLPGAKNACVYKMDFVEAMAKLAPRKEARVILYGASSKGLASAVAVSKLEMAGWSNVTDFKGGLEEWRNAGHPVEGTGAKDAPAPANKTYRLNAEESLIEWTGRNIGGKHTGALKLTSGEITIEAGKAVNGRFVIDMKSITNNDLADQTLAALLVRHLMSDDFFDVTNYPEGELTIASMDPIPDASPGRPNHHLRGKLKLTGIERDIEFPVLVGMRADGALVAQAAFEIDRTQWKILYGSGRFFENLGMHLVNDLVGVQLKIVVN